MGPKLPFWRGINAKLQSKSNFLDQSGILPAIAGRAESGISNTIGGIAGNAAKLGANAANVLSNRPGLLTAGAANVLSNRPGLLTAGAAIGAGAFGINHFTDTNRISRNSNMLSNGPNRVAGAEMTQYRGTGMTDRQFQNSAAGLTFGLHNKRHR